jgi:hypothetical protein
MSSNLFYILASCSKKSNKHHSKEYKGAQYGAHYHRCNKGGPFQEETKNQYIYQSNEEDGHQVPIHQ